LEYLDLFYKLGRAGRTLDRIGAIDFATTVAPGMREVLLTGKAYEARRPRDAGRPPDRQGVRGPPPPGQAAAVRLRRGGPRRTADRQDQPIPQRQNRGRRGGSDGADPPGRGVGS